MKSISIKVTGKVQGVFFRVSAKEKADQLNLRGWVKNEQDGGVMIHAEGDENSIGLLIEWCKEGPPMAKVLDIKVEEVPLQHFDSFNVFR